MPKKVPVVCGNAIADEALFLVGWIYVHIVDGVLGVMPAIFGLIMAYLLPYVNHDTFLLSQDYYS